VICSKKRVHVMQQD